MSNDRYNPPGLEGKVQTWDVIDQCQITTTLVPFWLKFCRTTHDNFIAFFAGPDPAPYLPAATPAEGVLHWENDQFHPINDTDRMLKTTSFEPLVGAYVVADFNPVPGTVDYPVIISIGGVIYMGARPYPPGKNPPHARDSQSRWKVLPKNRILVPATCTFGGVPCNPQIMATQATAITAWLPGIFPGDPVTFIGFPITNRRPDNKIGFDVLTGFPGCCLQDAVLTIIDDIYGVVTIDEPVGGIIPATSLVTPVVLNIKMNEPSLPAGTYNIPFNIQISSPDCGSMVFPVDIPVEIQCTPEVAFNPTGGSYNITFTTPSDGVPHAVQIPGVVGPTVPPVKTRDSDVPADATFDLIWAACCLDDATVTVDDPTGFVTMAGGGPQGVTNGTPNPTIGLLLHFGVIPPGESGTRTINLILTTANCGEISIPYEITYVPCPCSFTAAENTTSWFVAAGHTPTATPLLANTPGSVYTPDIDVNMTYSQCMLEDLSVDVIATGGRVLYYTGGGPIGISNGTLNQLLTGLIFDLQSVTDAQDIADSNIAFTLHFSSATCGDQYIPFLIPITP